MSRRYVPKRYVALHPAGRHVPGGQLSGGVAGIAGGKGQVDQVAARIDGRQALADEEDWSRPDDMGPVRVVFHPYFGYF